MTDAVTAIIRSRMPDPVSVAFHAVACLDEQQRRALAEKFNRSFGQCTPPLSIAFMEPTQ